MGFDDESEVGERTRILASHLERIQALPEAQRPAAIEAFRRQHPTLADPSLWRSLLGEGATQPSDASPRSPLTTNRSLAERHELRGEIARGAMGRILRYHDRELGREFVRKTLALPEGLRPGDRDAWIHRFSREARITSRLDHPNIVPVHDVGIDDEGLPYFTMAEVRGETLGAFLSRRDPKHNAADRVEALRILEQVCFALAFAHSHGVVHRDVKPANVMVGPFSEVYLMDWGLARVPGELDVEDRGGSTSEAAHLETLPGMVLGTPSYMAPEQAAGHVDEVGPSSDVFAVGAILFEILTGQPVHVPRSGEMLQQLLERIARGPGSLAELDRREVPAELASIARKALQADPTHRYDSAEELAVDLRAHLEGRVVEAHATGPWVAFAKWYRRNRVLASALSVTALGLVVTLLILTVLYRSSEERLNELLDLAIDDRLNDLDERADALWPLDPALRPRIEAWAQDAREVASQLPTLRQRLAAMRASGRSTRTTVVESGALRALEDQRDLLITRLAAATGTSRGILQHLITRVEREARDLEGTLECAAETWAFEDHDGLSARQWSWRHGLLSTLVTRLSRFVEGPPCESELHGCAGDTLPELSKRLVQVDELTRETLESGEALDSWCAMRQSVRDAPAPYGDLSLAPQFGLLPLRRDPDTKLWEFYAPMTGSRPTPSARRSEDALVFVLLPAGRFRMGAQATQPTERNYDSYARDAEQPVSVQIVEAYFLAKYEMTQGQWRRLTHANPSGHSLESGSRFLEPDQEDMHPVESITWQEARLLMNRLGWRLPTEIEWEYAARSGCEHPWVRSNSIEAFLASNTANIADERAHAAGYNVPYHERHDDGFPVHAPIGSLAPNDFGLYDMLGNVAEFCDDEYLAYPLDPARPRPVAPDVVISRGMTFLHDAKETRCSRRYALKANQREWTTGVRPARSISAGSSR